MPKAKEAIINRFAEILKAKIQTRVSGDIRKMLFFLVDSAIVDLNKETKHA